MNTVQWALRSLRHPIEFLFDFPDELRGRDRLKLMHAGVILLCAIAARVVSLLVTGFALQTQEPHQVSILVEATWIIVPWLTWSAASWGVSTIVEGEGKFIDILTTSTFILVPYIPLSLGIAALSNLMTLSNGPLGIPNTLYVTMLGFMFAWMLLQLFLHVKVLHDFEFRRTFLVIALSVVGMFIVWFVGLLLFGLINQAIQFVVTIYKEIAFRL
ncbi:YIP1 family protein [Cohnella cellulosilytica]|uniref:YIP1 family protein n=1 Tax=Cohnella cellulosilytica TaxID=986710 RepID=A0ABW2FNI4_9BACL